MHRIIWLPILLLQFAATAQFPFSAAEANSQPNPKGIWGTDWSYDDKYIAIGGDDSLLRIYNAQTFKLYKVYHASGEIKHLTWHPDNKRIAYVSREPVLHILNVETDDTVRIEGVTNGSRAIDWNYNGELLATADGSGKVRIWSADGRLLRTITKPDNKSYLSLDWHPGKNLLIVSGDDIRIMDTSGATLQVIKHRKEYTGILTVRWHPSGDFFVSGDYGHHNEGVPSLIQFWDTEGKLIRTLQPGTREFRILSWNRTGDRLASSGDALRIWTKDGKLLHEAPLEVSPIWGLDWNKSGDKIIMTTYNGAMKSWTGKGKLIRVIY
jgi:WD40 repeat protein